MCEPIQMHDDCNRVEIYRYNSELKMNLTFLWIYVDEVKYKDNYFPKYGCMKEFQYNLEVFMFSMKQWKETTTIKDTEFIKKMRLWHCESRAWERQWSSMRLPDV